MSLNLKAFSSHQTQMSRWALAGGDPSYWCSSSCVPSASSGQQPSHVRGAAVGLCFWQMKFRRDLSSAKKVEKSQLGLKPRAKGSDTGVLPERILLL